jgi:small subunit ribosomal protein S9
MKKITSTTKKKTAKKKTVKKAAPKTAVKKAAGKFFEEIGRRKTASARVRISKTGGKEVLINNKKLEEYFPTFELQETVLAPLKKLDYLNDFRVSAKVRGGGIHAQAEAIRHGIAKALVDFNPENRQKLKKTGYLTRDPRMRERKKFGLKRARRAPQWKKR